MFGPLVLVLLVLLLAVVAFHAAQDGVGIEAAAPLCVAVIAIVFLVIAPASWGPLRSVFVVRLVDRGPPRIVPRRRPTVLFSLPLVVPLRR